MAIVTRQGQRMQPITIWMQRKVAGFKQIIGRSSYALRHIVEPRSQSSMTELPIKIVCNVNNVKKKHIPLVWLLGSGTCSLAVVRTKLEGRFP
jgi:hypothetical protein